MYPPFCDSCCKEDLIWCATLQLFNVSAIQICIMAVTCLSHPLQFVVVVKCQLKFLVDAKKQCTWCHVLRLYGLVNPNFFLAEFFRMRRTQNHWLFPYKWWKSLTICVKQWKSPTTVWLWSQTCFFFFKFETTELKTFCKKLTWKMFLLQSSCYLDDLNLKSLKLCTPHWVFMTLFIILTLFWV